MVFQHITYLSYSIKSTPRGGGSGALCTIYFNNVSSIWNRIIKVQVQVNLLLLTNGFIIFQTFMWYVRFCPEDVKRNGNQE